jgi:hypothetical protein
VIDLVEAALDVGVERPPPALEGDRLADGLLGMVGREPGPKPVARGQEAGLEDRLKRDPRRRHHHPVGHRGDAERPGLAPPARLRDTDSPKRPRPVAPGAQPGGEPIEELARSRASISSIVTPSTPAAPRF